MTGRASIIGGLWRGKEAATVEGQGAFKRNQMPNALLLAPFPLT